MKNSVSSKTPLAPAMSRSKILTHLESFPQSRAVFDSLSEKQQDDFLAFCSGEASLYVCYDIFFQKIFDIYTHPERIESFLTALFGQPVKILEILTRQGSQLSDTSSFVVMDIVARLADSSIINIEMQKNGYFFPAKRFDCYTADLIMREYNRLKNKFKEKFSYSKMPPVISIALIEKSTGEFHNFSDVYLHKCSMQSDTGIQLKNLVNHIYIPLDIFHTLMHNKPIETLLDAWLTFFTTNSLTRIEELIQSYPEFADIYQEIFEFRTKPEELIYMFQKALHETDRINEQYLIDQMSEELNKIKADYNQTKEDLSQLKVNFDQTKEDLSQKDEEILRLRKQLAELTTK